MALLPTLPSLVVIGTATAALITLPGFANWVFTGKTMRRIRRDEWDIRMDARDDYAAWREANKERIHY